MSGAVPRTKIDPETQGFDGVLADRLAEIQRAPRRFIGAGEDVRFQGVYRLVVAETKHAVIQFDDLHSRATIGESEQRDLTARASR